MPEEINGYIIQGCFGNYFSDEPADYDCELCGSHFTLATIGCKQDLIDYGLSEILEYVIDSEYVSNVQEAKQNFDKRFAEDEIYYKGNFCSVMEICYEDYKISDKEFTELAYDFIDREFSNE